MVVATSAIVAILLYEPDAQQFSQILADAPQASMSAVTRVELSLVIEGRNREAGRADLEKFLRQSQIDVIPVSLQQTEIAIEAFRRFGRGRHRAALNIGDCFSERRRASSRLERQRSLVTEVKVRFSPRYRRCSVAAEVG
jgi:ribonuclease VapC